MKKFLCFALILAFLLACLLFAGCFVSSNKTVSYADELFVSSVADPGIPSGFYEFNSICLLKESDLTVAVVGEEWEDQILTDRFANVLVNEDGSFVCMGEIQGRGNWQLDEFGAIEATASLNKGDISLFGFNADGFLFLEVVQEDGSSLSVCFAQENV